MVPVISNSKNNGTRGGKVIYTESCVPSLHPSSSGLFLHLTILWKSYSQTLQKDENTKEGILH